MSHVNSIYRIDVAGDCAHNNDENVDVANIDVQVDNVPIIENQMVKTCKKMIKIIVMIVLAIVLGSVITIYFYENNMDKLRC